MRAGLYARVSTHDQQTLPMQLSTMKDYARYRGWEVAAEVEDVASGASPRPRREELMKLARQRRIDAIVVWKLDRWGRSLPDLLVSLNELEALGVGFVSITEALDLTTPAGRALAGMLAVFAQFEREVLRDRIKAGIAQRIKDGKPHGRPRSAALKIEQIRALLAQGLSKRETAKRLGMSRTSVRRLMAWPQERFARPAAGRPAADPHREGQ
jgi:putative DNA-invertase from lambdoid prophage Rac